MQYIVKLPRGEQIDIFNLPEGFDVLVKQLFEEYTHGTSDEYRYVDKLGFIDCVVRHFNNDKDAEDIVGEMVVNRIMYEWNEEGRIITEDDVYCPEFMYDCVENGRKSSMLEQHFGADDHHIYDQIQRVLVKVITIVMTF